MGEHGNGREAGEERESFAELLERSPSRPARLESGERIGAKVLQVGAEWVFLDVGQKGEGVLDAKELLDTEGRPAVSPGDTIQVYFLGRDEGELRFTTRLAGSGSGTAQLEQAWEHGIPVEGRVEQEVKGGYAVRLPGGVRAFCPHSQIGLRRQEGAPDAVGLTLPFRITAFGERGRSLVVSHRAVLEEERRRRRETLRRTLREGLTVKGTVTAIRAFGAFVDIGGLEGLIPVSEVRWGWTKDLSETLRVGQEVEVVVKSLDWEKSRFTFSLRAALADPWATAVGRYPPGSTHRGRVARLAPFGAFVTLEEGIDGLVHISKLGEGRRINHPREVLREGEAVVVTVEEVDPERRRLTLAPATASPDVADHAAYVDRPAPSIGTLGEVLRARLEEKKKPAPGRPR